MAALHFSSFDVTRWRKIALNQKAVDLFLKLLKSHSYCANSPTMLQLWQWFPPVSIQPAKVHYWLLQITVSKAHGWPELCLSSLADRQRVLLMGTAWAGDWHLKGQTLNVVTSSDSRPTRAPLPFWAHIDAVASDRSTCSSWWAASVSKPLCACAHALGADAERLMGIFCFKPAT